MWQATRKAAELIKLVTYSNNMNAFCAYNNSVELKVLQNVKRLAKKISSEIRYIRKAYRYTRLARIILPQECSQTMASQTHEWHHLEGRQASSVGSGQNQSA